MEAVNLLSSNKYSEKQIVSGLLFDRGDGNADCESESATPCVA